jgi:PBP1b-binding outer membrane lipoprotein LpoB
MSARAAGKPGGFVPATLLLAAILLTGCADPPPPASVHDAADRMFLDLVLIARRDTLPTQGDTTLLIKGMDEIKRGNDSCAQWKLDQILTIGMPLAMQMMTADQTEQQQIRLTARRQLRQASEMQLPALCHGHGFPPAKFN